MKTKLIKGNIKVICRHQGDFMLIDTPGYYFNVKDYNIFIHKAIRKNDNGIYFSRKWSLSDPACGRSIFYSEVFDTREEVIKCFYDKFLEDYEKIREGDYYSRLCSMYKLFLEEEKNK